MQESPPDPHARVHTAPKLVVCTCGRIYKGIRQHDAHVARVLRREGEQP